MAKKKEEKYFKVELTEGTIETTVTGLADFEVVGLAKQVILEMELRQGARIVASQKEK